MSLANGKVFNSWENIFDYLWILIILNKNFNYLIDDGDTKDEHISIGPNDEIIEKALKKSRVESIPVKITLDVGSMTKFGWLIMPDANGGQGPLYIAKLRVTE